MRAVVRAMCLLGCSIALGCITIPPTPKTPITLPVSFEVVWFRQKKASPGLLAMSDTGTVVVGKYGVSFTGKKGSVEINYSTMKMVSFEKHGIDLYNNWVTIKYLRENEESYALFSGGKSLGWGGIGDAAEIFQALDSALQQRGLSSIVRRK